MEAIKNGNKETINRLLDSGADIILTVVCALADPKNSNYNNKSFEAILQSLLDHGWDVNIDLAIMHDFFFSLPTFDTAKRFCL